MILQDMGRGSNPVSNKAVKTINKLRILQHLYWNSGETQLSLSHTLKLSSPTITQALHQFKNNGLVAEGDEIESSGGRRPRLIKFNYDAMYAVGVEIRKHHIYIVYTNMNGSVVHECTTELRFENTKSYWTSINKQINETVASHLGTKRILGIGIAFPGEVSVDGTTIVRATVLGISNEPIDNIQLYFDYDVIVENAANTAGFGAVWLSHGIADAVYLIVTDNGVAGSLIMNNQIFRGSNANGKAGAFGHMVLQPGGKPCHCGGGGCWSTYCALSNLQEQTQGDLSLFFIGLEKGDLDCKKKWDEYLQYFAQALCNIRLSLDMNIIIGGKIARYISGYLGDLQTLIRQYPSMNNEDGFVSVDKLNGNSLAIGAAMIFVNRLLEGDWGRLHLDI